jgi:hypothetical protein
MLVQCGSHGGHALAVVHIWWTSLLACPPTHPSVVPAKASCLVDMVDILQIPEAKKWSDQKIEKDFDLPELARCPPMSSCPP